MSDEDKTYEAPLVYCAEPGCKNSFKNHAWGRIKSGWFQKKDDTTYCPEHIPEWVEAWRAKKRSRS